MAKVVVPSDISICEEKYAVGKRRIRLFEYTGLLGIPPMIHFRYTKNNTTELKDVLSKRYPKDSSEPIVILLKQRQESIRKQVLAQNLMWVGTGAAAGMGLWGMRNYNLQSKLMVVPFAAYFGSFVGRSLGDCFTYRNMEYGRDRFLGQLPAHTFLQE